MKQFLLAIVFCVCSIGQMTAQSISGKVVDEKNRPLPYVSVILQNVQDSTYISGIATNDEGVFSLPAKPNIEYALLVSYIGYKTIYKACKTGDVGIIIMKADTMMLKDVSVIASKAVHDANGYTINLRSSEITKGKVSSDALVFLPGISKDENNYKINGLPVSEIYVDGVKLTSSEELKNLPADMIDKVKVNYLAGSNQNAALSGGTIEITLRQPPQGGYYGTLTGGLTIYPSYGFSNENIGGVMYCQYKNLSIYDNLSFNFNQPEETAEQSIYSQTTDLLTEIDEDTKFRGHNISNRLSLTQQINSKNAIGGSYYIATNRLNTTSLTSGRDIAAILSHIKGKSSYLEQEVTLKYSSQLSHTGATLEIRGDYSNRQSESKSEYSYNDNTSNIAEDETSLNLYRLSIDLSNPRSQKLMWKYGASIQYITSDYTPTSSTNNGSDRFPTSQIATHTSGLTPLAYISAMGQFKKVRYSAGVNWQLNKIQYKTLDNNKVSSKIQWDINPMIMLMMPLDKNGKHNMMLNYKHILDVIPYSAISSTIRWSDPYNYTIGNPDLKSPTGDLVIAGTSLFHNLLNLTAIYIHTKDNVYWETLQSPTASDVFYTIPINLPSTNMYGAGAEIKAQ